MQRKYAIIIPSGSGKSTLAYKYKQLYDIDEFTTEKEHIILKQISMDAMKTGNWDCQIQTEYYLIKDKIMALPENSIILLHCSKKAKLNNLDILGTLKITKNLMLQVAQKRQKAILNGDFHQKCTIYNWYTTNNAKICESFQELENEVVQLCKNNNITLVNI